jgi:hypothetical protein
VESAFPVVRGRDCEIEQFTLFDHTYLWRAQDIAPIAANVGHGDDQPSGGTCKNEQREAGQTANEVRRTHRPPLVSQLYHRMGHDACAAARQLSCLPERRQVDETERSASRCGERSRGTIEHRASGLELPMIARR